MSYQELIESVYLTFPFLTMYFNLNPLINFYVINVILTFFASSTLKILGLVNFILVYTIVTDQYTSTLLMLLLFPACYLHQKFKKMLMMFFDSELSSFLSLYFGWWWLEMWVNFCEPVTCNDYWWNNSLVWYNLLFFSDTIADLDFNPNNFYLLVYTMCLCYNAMSR